MRQLTFVRAGKAEWREVASPQIDSPLAAIIRPRAVGRCDLDTAYMRGVVPLTTGEPIGHEMIGEVMEVGDGVLRISPGDTVICSAQICCGKCGMCRRGFTGRCEAVPFAASYGMGREGGYGCLAADLAYVPFADAMLAPLPAGADPAAMIGTADMALDAWRAVGPQLVARPGARVLVLGGQASVIALYAAGIAQAQGASEVVYADGDAARRDQAARYGCATCDPAAIEGSFGIVVEGSGTVEALTMAFQAAEPEALVTSVAIHFGAATPVPLQAMYWKGVTFSTGRPNCRSAVEPLLACCRAGVHGRPGFRPDVICQSVHNFDDMPDAWGEAAIRVVACRA